MNRNKVKAAAEGLLCSMLSVVLILAGMLLPVLQLLLTMLSGIPMMYLAMRHKPRVLVPALLISVLALMIVRSWSEAILIGVMNFLPGMVMGYTLRVRKTFVTIIFSGAAVLLVGMVLQLAYFNFMTDGQGVTDTVNQVMEEVRQNTSETLASLEGQFSAEKQEMEEALNQVLDTTKEMIFLYLPSFLIGSAVLTGYLLFMLGAFVLHRTRPVRIIYQPFWGICAPKSMCYVAMILFIITSSSESSTIWMAALQNMMVLMYAYLAVCGVSLVDYKVRKKISSGYARAFVYFLVLCVGYLFLGTIFQGMCILGIIDGFLGFRIREERISHE